MSALATLVHDVGKYVARTARNLPPGEVSGALVAMLCRDLYALDGTRRASEVFAERRAGLSAPELDECARDLRVIDELETRVRAADDAAVREAAALALRIEQRLRELLR